MSDRVVSDPTICSGKPTIRGTRNLVSVLIGLAEGVYTIPQILAAYPDLTEEDVRAALSDGTEGRTRSEG